MAKRKPRLFARGYKPPSGTSIRGVDLFAANGHAIKYLCLRLCARYTGYRPPADGSKEEVEIIIRPVRPVKKRRPK